MKWMKVRQVFGLLVLLYFSSYFLACAQNQQSIDSFNLYYSLKDYSKAMDFWESVKCDSNNFNVMLKTGNCFHYLGNQSEALNYYFHAKSLLSIKDSTNQINLLINIGNTYEILGQKNIAWDYFSKALELNENHRCIHEARLNLSVGQYFSNLGEHDSAEKYMLLALSSYKKQYGELSERILYVYDNLITFYRNRAEESKAIYYGEKGLNICTQLSFKSPWWIFSFNYNLALVYYSLMDWNQAIYYFNNALCFISRNKNEFQPYIESALAYCYSKTGTCAPDSIFTINQNGVGQIDTVAYAYHLICYGKHLINQNSRPSEAAKNYRKAFQLLQCKYGLYHDALKDIYYIFGVEAQKRQQYDSALFYLQRSLYSNSVEVDTSDYSSNPRIIQQADQWTLDLVDRKLRVLSKISQQSLATDSAMSINLLILSNSHDYIHMLESLLHNKTFLSDKMTILRDDIRKRMLYAVNACYNLYRQTNKGYYFEQGLEFSEAGKYLLLKSMLDDKSNKAGLPLDLVKHDRYLQNQINKLHLESTRLKGDAQSKDKANGGQLNEQLFKLIVRKDSLRNVILNRYPRSQRFETFHFSLKKIIDQINQQQILVEYFLQDSVLHAFYISATGIAWKRIDNAADMYTAIERIRKLCDLAEYSSVSKTEYINDAAGLMDILLTEADSLNHLATDYIIIPDGELIYLPFDILLTTNVKASTTYREMPYLFLNHTIAYYHSLQFIFDNQSLQTDKDGKFLAMAPEFEGDALQASRQNPNKLAGAEFEAAYLVKLLDGELLAGEDATKENFFRRAPGKGILHFATHAALDPKNAFDSYILLSADTETQEPQRLFASEICCMDLDAGLTVLNSCHSGSGNLLAGEGVMSLAWAFRYAGCKSVVTSLFQLDDESARQIMTSFYVYLKAGKTKTDALRQAKLDFLDEIILAKTHPRYWAGLMVAGDQRALEIKEDQFRKNIIYAALILTGLLMLLLFIRKRYLWKKKI
jgi:CHAT domain-containing protein